VKLEFENWVESQGFTQEVKDLFNESILCYKASAYRASLLYSYLAFQTILKLRILEATKPEHYHEKAWEAICNNLRKEE
jgi:hypothetical protein